MLCSDEAPPYPGCTPTAPRGLFLIVRFYVLKWFWYTRMNLCGAIMVQNGIQKH